jgi:hypothetical protein
LAHGTQSEALNGNVDWVEDTSADNVGAWSSARGATGDGESAHAATPTAMPNSAPMRIGYSSGSLSDVLRVRREVPRSRNAVLERPDTPWMSNSRAVIRDIAML